MGVLSGMFGAKGGGATPGPPCWDSFDASAAPSWAELGALVASRRAALGMPASPPCDEGGPTNPRALRRTFGSSEEPRVKLYRDSAAWCPYCEKVWLQLEEKRIPYTVEKVNMRCYGEKHQSFLEKVPSGMLPAMEVDGRLYTESAQIQQVLEASFPGHAPLLPAQGTREAQVHDQLMGLERALFGRWMQWLTSSWNDKEGRAGFEEAMGAVDDALAASGGPFFCGEELRLVDLTFAPFMERIAASVLYYKGCVVRGEGRWPSVERWFEAMEGRGPYAAIRSDYYTHAHDLPPQLGGCAPNGRGDAFAAAIDGTDGSSWRLPLPPLGATTLPEPDPRGDSPAKDRLEAAGRLVANHDAVVRFAARGSGKPGTRRYGAALADPTAGHWEEDLPAVDAALRLVCAALLRPGDDADTAAALAPSAPAKGEGLPASPAVKGAAYLRDRVGVPRDMAYPAARQLRAHLNWVIDTLEGREPLRGEAPA